MTTHNNFKVLNPEPGSKNINLVSQIFGLLTIIEYYGVDKYKNKLWKCKCKCGKICTATTTCLKSGKKKSCGCNQYKKGKDVYNYTGYKDITGSKWYSIKSNAASRNLDFKITKQYIWSLYIEQNMKCYFSGLPISYIEGNASIDRINNSLGYTNNNVVIVHKDINLMRNKFSVKYFKKLCKLVNNK